VSLQSGSGGIAAGWRVLNYQIQSPLSHDGNAVKSITAANLQKPIKSSQLQVKQKGEDIAVFCNIWLECLLLGGSEFWKSPSGVF
jgi:hypothetical protein